MAVINSAAGSGGVQGEGVGGCGGGTRSAIISPFYWQILSLGRNLAVPPAVKRFAGVVKRDLPFFRFSRRAKTTCNCAEFERNGVGYCARGDEDPFRGLPLHPPRPREDFSVGRHCLEKFPPRWVWFFFFRRSVANRWNAKINGVTTGRAEFRAISTVR